MADHRYDEVLALYEAVTSGYDGISVKGRKNRYTAMNGNMFSFLDPEGLLCFRLGDGDKAEYEAAHGTGDVMQYGAVMRGYVPVVATVLENEAALRDLFDKAVANAMRLKPKPTKRK